MSATELAVQPAAPKVPRLLGLYRQVATEALVKKFDLDNVWRVPRLEKIVINMGVSAAKEDAKFFEQMKEDMARIAGQSPLVCRAKKYIAGFKLRQGEPIGLKVTLR